MPTNHGIYRKSPTNPVSGERLTPEECGVFGYGFSRVFEAMARGRFLADPNHKKRARQLECHFPELLRRFVFSLQHLSQAMQEMTRLYAEPAITLALRPVELEAGIQADHVLSYLGTLVDDIAVGMTLATGYFGPDPKKPIDSVGGLKGKQTESDLVPVAALLGELDNTGSWWNLAFKPKAGGRQLLVHNQYLVDFQASSTAGGPFQASAHVASPWADNVVPVPDFFALLRDILTSLFDWLDRLENVLMTHLKPRDSAWKPFGPACPSFVLPVGWPAGRICLDSTYFPLPLCDGSDALPWYANGIPKPPFVFTSEEIAYGAFCIDEEEKRNGRQNDPKVNWFKAKDRLSLIRAGLPFAQ